MRHTHQLSSPGKNYLVGQSQKVLSISQLLCVQMEISGLILAYHGTKVTLY